MPLGMPKGGAALRKQRLLQPRVRGQNGGIYAGCRALDGRRRIPLPMIVAGTAGGIPELRFYTRRSV